MNKLIKRYVNNSPAHYLVSDQLGEIHLDTVFTAHWWSKRKRIIKKSSWTSVQQKNKWNIKMDAAYLYWVKNILQNTLLKEYFFYLQVTGRACVTSIVVHTEFTVVELLLLFKYEHLLLTGSTTTSAVRESLGLP